MLDKFAVVATVVVAATAAISLILLWMKGKRIRDSGKRYPPSSPVLTLIGALLRGGMSVIPDHIMRSAEKLGPVISYNFGYKRVIILNGKEAISEAFLRQSETFADRTPLWTELNIVNRSLRGIILSRYDHSFKKYHKLCLTILKEFGFGVNNVSEMRIHREVESWNQEILKFNGRSFDPQPLTVTSTSSVVNSILFGDSLTRSDTCHRISQTVGQYVRSVTLAIDFAPVLRFLPSFRRKISFLDKCHKDMLNSIEEAISFNKTTECESTFVRRFLEILEPGYDHQDLLYIVRDLCIGSADTVSTTLMWALVELTNHPEVQSRFQREIDDVVTRSRLPSLDDKPRLPYTEAVILEVMRRRNILPLYIPHATLKDAEVLGCSIPRGSMVLANAFSVHMDPKFWIDPQNFRPERFLDEKHMITGREQVIPFGIGKRSCLGEILARQEVFLFLTSLVQRFDIRPPEDQDSIRVKEVTSLGVFPSKFEVRFIPRTDE